MIIFYVVQSSNKKKFLKYNATMGSFFKVKSLDCFSYNVQKKCKCNGIIVKYIEVQRYNKQLGKNN